MEQHNTFLDKRSRVIKILSLSPYPLAGASVRYRAYAFCGELLSRNVELKIEPFMTPEVFELRRGVGNKNARVLVGIAMGFLRRFWQALFASRKYDLIYIHRQAFPLFQRFLDPLFIRNGVPIVFDMDDAVFTEYPIDHLLRGCAAVTVGNSYLADYVRRVAPRVPVTVVPTTIDLNQYTVRSEVSTQRPIVGWIGTSSTFTRYLLPVLPALVEATHAGGGEFRVIASVDVKKATEAAGAIFIPWSLETEISELKKFDVGVMPLHEDDYVHGKCAFKLIQYGAVGIPSIGTNIGANGEVISECTSGFLTDTTKEMQERIITLLQSPKLRREMGAAARTIIEQRFSLQSQVDVMATVFTAAQEKSNVRN